MNQKLEIRSLCADDGFVAEARRQSLEAAAAARDPNSDEAKVMQELMAELATSAAEWR